MNLCKCGHTETEHSLRQHFATMTSFCPCEKFEEAEATPKPSGKEWCEHIVHVKEQVHDDMPGYYLEGYSSIYDGAFCKYCAAPRPVERSLEDKFSDHWKSCHISGDKGEMKHLADIAAQHYGEKEGSDGPKKEMRG